MVDETFERKVLACLLLSGEFCSSVARHLKPSYFESVVRHNIGKLAIDFHLKYQAKLSHLGFTEGIKDMVRHKVIAEADITLYVEEYRKLTRIS